MTAPILLNRKQPPSFQRPQFFEFPKVQSLDKDVFSYFSDTVPLIKVDLVYSSVISQKKGGAKILAKMLTEGTSTLSSFEVSETTAKYGAHLEIKAGADKFVITLYTQKKYLNELITFLSSIINESTIPEKELEKVKKIEIQNLQVNKEKTSFVASNKFKEIIFGSNHPYGEIVEEEDITKITKEDIVSLYRQMILENSPEIFICGDYSETDYRLIKNSFQNNHSKHTTITFPVATTSNTLKHHITITDAVQSSIRLGKPSIDRLHTDFIDMLIANEILGGYFGSRLMKNIREEKGLTYGIYSQCVTQLQNSYWVIGADIKKDLVNLAIDEINNEIETLATTGVDQEELETVSNYMAGSFLSSINTPFDIIDKFKLVHYHGLSYGYYKTFYERLFTITSEDIQKMTTTYFKNNIEVIVG